VSRYLQNNALDGLDGLDQLPNLETLNVSNNRLSQLPFMAGCPKLATFLGAHNDLSSAECIQTLVFCTALTTVDLQENGMADAQVLFCCLLRGHVQGEQMHQQV
jgi:Leucine-rich repeat (LRR) protein